MGSADLNAYVRAAFAKAREKLAAARDLRRLGHLDDAASRAYYAAYHAVEAALRAEGSEARTHEGLRTLFGLRFVQTGRVPRELGRALTHLKEERENGDYSVVSTLTAEDVDAAIAAAERLVGAMAAHLASLALPTD